MTPALVRLLGPLAAIISGRPSLQLVVFASVVLFWAVALLAAYMLAFRLYHGARLYWTTRRGEVYQKAVELVLLEEPLEAVVEAFRPRYPGDRAVVENELTGAMRHLRGAPFETLGAAARRLGLVDSNLARVRSRRRRQRARAAENLGLMRAPEALEPLVALVRDDAPEVKLIALRSLALIGDARALPAFVEVADRLSPAMMVRLASLMMEFGAPARPFIAQLISRHPRAFPPRVMRLLLIEAAAADEDKA